ncbi:MAG: hypothetical protein FIB05_14190 [Betaproteobacteria bacterium]|nr:hypothetical protein [Betaproteobacteria bacterium]PWB60531.1 MAG: hypothetical protein C3F16_10190 [Betaproteobacteria bacterium]
MAPEFTSSFPVALALGTAAGAAISAAALIAALLVLRLWRGSRDRRLAIRVAGWRAALHEAMDDPAAARLPPVAPADLPVFLRLYNHLQESLRGEAAAHLSQAVRAAGLVAPIRDLSRRRNLAHRLAAVVALGHLREVHAWEDLAALARTPDAVLSFAAARALLRIDAARALEFLPDALRRQDWSLARLGTALQEAGPEAVTPAVERLLASPPPEGLERLLKLARFAHRERVAPIVNGWLARSAQPRVIAAALDFAQDAADLAQVRGAARYPDWGVRMAAARALGRIGSQRELALLLGLLEDESWWVRYHAAQAIVSLPGLSAAELADFRARAQGAAAGGMLAQVLAERAPS